MSDLSPEELFFSSQEATPDRDQQQAELHHNMAHFMAVLMQMKYAAEMARRTEDPETAKMAVYFGSQLIDAIGTFFGGEQKKAINLIAYMLNLQAVQMMRERGHEDIVEYIAWINTPEGQETVRNEARAAGVIM